jgi:hypothetical protein
MDIKNHIRNELFKNIENFTNEIDLLFDYIPKETVQKINLYIKDIKKSEDNLNNFLDISYDRLKEFEVDMSCVLFSKQKIKTQRLNFMNEMRLYPLGEEFLLNLDVFNSENKNTKKSLLKYVYNIYMTCSFLRRDSKDPSESLNEFVLNIEREVQEARAREDALNAPKIEDENENEDEHKNKELIPRYNNNSHKYKNTMPNTMPVDLVSNLQSLLSSGFSGGLPGGGSLPGGMDKMMSSLFNNNEIMGLATDIAEQMKTQQINPMSVLTEMMSGNMNNLSENSQFGKLMGDIQQKVESKINSGQINKELFEQEAKNVLENVNKENNDMPGLSDIMANMMKNMNMENVKTPKAPNDQDNASLD